MTADDMEAVVERVEALVLTYGDNTQYDAFCTLLLDYQERGRALEPFALAADNMDGDEPDSLFIYDSPESTMISYGDLRRARASLKGKSHD
jgi:hypothetical protein